MKMVPNRAYPGDSKAELKVFDRLTQAFTNQNDAYYALHSLNLTWHEYKRFGEIDFLVICPSGLYVLEVKGGQVACDNGQWHFTNRFGKTDKSFESPFRQAQSALHGLQRKLQANLPHDIINQFSIGYGVITPDCNITAQGAEWEAEVLCGSLAYRDLQGWLNKLFKYWLSKNNGLTASEAAITQVVEYLRPSFEAVVYKGDIISTISDNIETLTEAQLQLTNIIAANPRVLCTGGAGTGKTFMAVRLAMHWAQQGRKTALVCHSSWLQSYLQYHYSHPNLIIQTVEGIQASIRRSQLAVEVLIVDEAQDILNEEVVTTLAELLDGGLEYGRWCLFMDINQQSGLCGYTDLTVLDRLQGYQPATVPLTTNCRNTQQILQTLKEWLNADMGVTGAGEGLPVISKDFDNIADLICQIDKDIDSLINADVIDYSQITILLSSTLVHAYPDIERDILKSSLAQNYTIRRCDNYSIGHFPPAAISLLESAEFKGLENDIVFSLGHRNDLVDNKNEAYVAMSRARSMLYVYSI